MPLRFTRFAVLSDERANAYFEAVQEHETRLQLMERHPVESSVRHFGHMAVAIVAREGDTLLRGLTYIDGDDVTKTELYYQMQQRKTAVAYAFRLQHGYEPAKQQILPEGWVGIAVLYEQTDDMDAIHDEVHMRMGDRVRGTAAKRRQDETAETDKLFEQFSEGMPGPRASKAIHAEWEKGVRSVVVDPIPEHLLQAYLELTDRSEPPGAA